MRKSTIIYIFCFINAIIFAQIPQKNNVLLKDWKRINLENVGNYYISLDLIKANFQALKKYSKKILIQKFKIS